MTEIITLYGIARNGHRDRGYPLYRNEEDRNKKLREENNFTFGFMNEMDLNLSYREPFSIQAIQTEDGQYFLLEKMPAGSVQE